MTSIFTSVTMNMNPQNISLFLLGCVVYFLLEYKAKRVTPGFQVGYWLKDNWYNLLISLAFMIAYLINTAIPDGWVIFVMGACPNYVIDRVVDIVSKYSAKKDA